MRHEAKVVFYPCLGWQTVRNCTMFTLEWLAPTGLTAWRRIKSTCATSSWKLKSARPDTPATFRRVQSSPRYPWAWAKAIWAARAIISLDLVNAKYPRRRTVRMLANWRGSANEKWARWVWLVYEVQYYRSIPANLCWNPRVTEHLGLCQKRRTKRMRGVQKNCKAKDNPGSLWFESLSDSMQICTSGKNYAVKYNGPYGLGISAQIRLFLPCCHQKKEHAVHSLLCAGSFFLEYAKPLKSLVSSGYCKLQQISQSICYGIRWNRVFQTILCYFSNGRSELDAATDQWDLKPA